MPKKLPKHLEQTQQTPTPGRVNVVWLGYAKAHREIQARMHFDCVNINLLSTIKSQIWHFLSMETYATKWTNEYDIKSTGLQ